MLSGNRRPLPHARVEREFQQREARAEAQIPDMASRGVRTRAVLEANAHSRGTYATFSR